VKHTVKQGGFALIAALFVLVVLAVIGTFAVRASVTQQNASDLDLLTAHADSALHTGVEYAAARLAPPNNCAALPPNLNLPTGVTVTFDLCIVTSYTVDSVAVNVFTVDLTAAQGAYGAPGFVSRSTRARVVY
jgi:MSHA biogenesis protein MshP